MRHTPSWSTWRANRSTSQIDAEAGDGLELVEGAAGVAQAAARHHRHRHAAGRDRGRQRDGDLVADAAGRVLVDLGPGDRRQVEDVTRPHHGVGPGRQLTVVEPAEVDRHEHRRDLVVGEAAVGDAGDEAAQLGGVSAPPSRLARINSTGRRAISSPSCRPRPCR
jgi:hypothetical protein